ncbi:DNA polymerase I [Bartonella sp. DGB2]|uniref:DNA polymerase I n=1 Tax=Bartonella sp. DGB2 TaxID=3388426 RepID=UPI00399039B6
MIKNGHIFLLDGSGYIFRAYHALPPLTRKSDGLPVGAVAGFCNMLWKLLCDARDTSLGVVPSHFAVIFDHSSDTFRKKLYPSYKANRSAPPEDLIVQFSLIREATRAFCLPAIEKPGFEADDLIATYARIASEKGLKTTIISSDKDLMQLVSDDVSMYDAMKDREIFIKDVVEKWGVLPEKMADLQALTGDSSDNIPGAPGIGPKTAAQLLEQFGDLETLLANASKIKQQKRREAIENNHDLIRLSKKLVLLDEYVPMDYSLDDLVLQEQDIPRLIGFLKTMEFTTLTRRIALAGGCDAALIEPIKIDTLTSSTELSLPLEDGGGDTPQKYADFVWKRELSEPINSAAYETIFEPAILESWLSEACKQGYLAFDTETLSLDPFQAGLVGFSICLAPGRAAYVPLDHQMGGQGLLDGGRQPEQMGLDIALSLLKPVLENPSILKIGQNIKYDWRVMRQQGITLQCFDDTMLLSYVLDASAPSHAMDALAARWLNYKPTGYKDVVGSGKNMISFAQVPIERASFYACEDADVTLRLWRVLKPQVVARGLITVYERLDRPLIDVVGRMEERGILVDRQILAKISGELVQGAETLATEIYKISGETFNLASPKQLGEVLFEKMGLLGGGKTKGGQWATSVQVLEDLAVAALDEKADAQTKCGGQLARKVIDWRQLTKLRSTYTDALPSYIAPSTGRVHSHYSLAATNTGRLSSSEPNLQNIPIRTKEGRRIRSAFIAPAEHFLLSADYSQIELRLLAHIADIKALKEAFAQGLDIHAMTASEIFQVPLKDMTSEIRRRAKAINFGIIYGISAFGLAQQLSIGREEASHYMKAYFERFPGIRDYMEETKRLVREQGYVKTLFDRRIYYPDITAKNPQIRAFNERAAINAPIQGSAADIIRRAMIHIEPELKEESLTAKMLLQVHDELIFEVLELESKKTIEVLKRVMENAAFPAVNLSVPLVVEAKAGKNWQEAH